MKRVSLWLYVLFLSSSALAAAERHRAVRTGDPSSEQLIAAALANGKIDAETALTYRVFAAFADCRLPSEFKGNDSDQQDTSVLRDVAAVYGTLSPATQARLAPFLLEPYEPGGWMQVRASTCGDAKTAEASPITFDSLFAVDGKVRIIYRTDIPGEDQIALRVRNALEQTIWPALTGVMGAPLPREPLPLPDGKLWHLTLIGFGDPRLSESVPGYMSLPKGACKYSPAFSGVASRHPMLLPIVAHELMHAIQYSFNVNAQCAHPEYKWLEEATATWAQDYVYPNPPAPPTGDSEHVQTAHFLGKPYASLDCVDEILCRDHEYGAYLLPFYIARRHGDAAFVKRIWDATTSSNSLDAVNAALGPYGGFEKEWPEFVRYNWNREPYNDYERWDQLTAAGNRADPSDDRPVALGSAPDRTYEMQSLISGAFEGPMELEPLSAQYFHYTFNDDAARSIAFFNGINFKLSDKPWPTVTDFGPLYVFDNAARPRAGLKIQALLKINGTWETTPRDWTQHPFVPFCRDIPAERLDEMVLIYSNSHYVDRTPIAAENLTPMLMASNIGCAGWVTDETKFTETDGGRPMKITWSAAVSRNYTSLDYVPQPTLPAEGIGVNFTTFTGKGDLTWDVNGSINACTYAGGSTMPLDQLILGIFTFTPPDALVRRSYSMVMSSSQMVHFTRVCGSSGSESYDQYLPGLTISPPIDLKTVNKDGLTIHGDHLPDFDRMGKIQWTLKYNK